MSVFKSVFKPFHRHFLERKNAAVTSRFLDFLDILSAGKSAGEMERRNQMIFVALVQFAVCFLILTWVLKKKTAHIRERLTFSLPRSVRCLKKVTAGFPFLRSLT